jgi:hypothetical protein
MRSTPIHPAAEEPDQSPPSLIQPDQPWPRSLPRLPRRLSRPPKKPS